MSLQEITDQIYEFDNSFSKEIIHNMLKTIYVGKDPTFIERYSHDGQLKTAWKNLKLFFGNNGLPKAWFYPEMDRDTSSALVIKSAYDEMSNHQKHQIDSEHIKKLLAPYEGQAKYFLVRHCIVRNNRFTVVRLERNSDWRGVTIAHSTHWFALNKDGKFQLFGMDGKFHGCPYDTPEQYLVENFLNSQLSPIVINSYSNTTRKYEA